MFIGVALILVGALFLLERLDIIEEGVWRYWPVLLIALGASVIFDRFRSRD